MEMGEISERKQGSVPAASQYYYAITAFQGSVPYVPNYVSFVLLEFHTKQNSSIFISYRNHLNYHIEPTLEKSSSLSNTRSLKQ